MKKIFQIAQIAWIIFIIANIGASFIDRHSDTAQMLSGISAVFAFWGTVTFYIWAYKSGAKMPSLQEKIPYTFSSITIMLFLSIFIAVLLYILAALYLGLL